MFDHSLIFSEKILTQEINARISQCLRPAHAEHQFREEVVRVEAPGEWAWLLENDGMLL
jgi:hypothetical protein